MRERESEAVADELDAALTRAGNHARSFHACGENVGRDAQTQERGSAKR
jgi:hypothetical protein